MDLSQVTLSQMRYAVAVSAHQNFRLAAEQCHVSQSGLSMQIQKLEELLGVRLFDRTKKPVLLTRAGERALVQMRRVLQETERLGQMVTEEAEPSGRFRLGVIPSMASTLLPLFLGDFAKRFARVHLLIEELKTEDIITRLLADTLDAGIAATPLSVPGLQEEALAVEPMVAYLPPGDPLLAKQALRERDLQGREVWVMPEGHCFRTQVLSYCNPAVERQDAQLRFESGSFETLIRLVDGGLGATVLPALVAQHLPAARRRAQVRPLTAPVPLREVGLVTARTDLRRQVNEALSAVLREVLAQALGEPPRRGLVLDPMARS